jgi:uncharacterized membrane protein
MSHTPEAAGGRAGREGTSWYSRDAAEFDRAIAFIDATFAVSLTLLITSLDIENRSKAFKGWSALYAAVGPQFIAFLIAFAVIAAYWFAHHRMVARFVAIDNRTIVANQFLLAAVVLLPFTTSSVGDPGVADLPLPTVLMAIDIAVVSVLFTLVWVTATRGELLAQKPSARKRFQSLVGGLAPAAVFLASVPIAYLAAPYIARLFWLSLIAVNPAIGPLASRFRGPNNECS